MGIFISEHRITRIEHRQSNIEKELIISTIQH